MVDILKLVSPGDRSGERGSLIVATLLFMVVFLGIASLAIDASRYFYQGKQLQSIADNAALAGGQVFNRYEDTAPDTATINNRILTYIKNHQGEEYLDLYPRNSSSDVEGIIVRTMNPPGESSTCTQGFAINDGNIVLNQPASVTTNVLGSAIQSGSTDVPVTARMEIQRSGESPTTVEPWGDYDDPNSGDLNTGGGIPPASLPPQDKGSTITTQAQSHLYGSPHIESEQGDDLSRTLSHGDEVPDLDGFAGQDDMNSFVQEYVGDDGRINLPQNEAIVFYELGTTDESSDAFDLQDLVLRVTVEPESSGAGGGSATNVSSSGSQSQPCNPFPDGSYRIGVVAYDQVDPYFWPAWLVGADDRRGFARTAVAQVIPQGVHRNFPDPNCGVFAGGLLSVTGNNLNAGDANFCGNSDIEAGGSSDGTMGDLFVPQGADRSVTPPGGGVGRTVRLPNPRPIPNFTDNDPSSFDVDLNGFGTWSDLGECGGGSKALRTDGSSGADVSWGSDGSAVCVSQDNDGNYTLDNNNGGLVQNSDGTPVTIYADNGMTFSGNGNGIVGGVYAEGDVEVTGNNYEFLGDSSEKGGLALWSEGTVDIDKNSTRIEGITGARGDYNFYNQGGGDGPIIEGVISTQGEFNMGSNSNNARIVHDRTLYDQAVLSGDWSDDPQQRVNQPLYSNVDVRLIN